MCSASYYLTLDLFVEKEKGGEEYLSKLNIFRFCTLLGQSKLLEARHLRLLKVAMGIFS